MVYSFNIKSAATAWFAGTAQNYGIMLTAGGSADEGIVIEAKELRDVDGNNTAGSHMVVSYTEYVADGVYAFRNASYSTSFLSVTDDNPLAGGSLSLKPFMSGTTPADTTNFSTSRASLFKVSRVGSTNRYIIRSMLNSNLTFAVSANGSITTKTIPSDDADVAFSDTFYLEADSYGFSIIPAAYSAYLLSASSSSSVTTVAVDPNVYYTRYGWRLSQYAGTHRCGTILEYPSSHIVGTAVTHTPVVWSTRINVNAPFMSIASSYASLATGVWNSTAETFTVMLHDKGTIAVQVYVRGTSTTYSAGSFSFTLTLPHKEATYYIENAATTRFMDVEGPSTANGAAIQQRAFHGGTQSRWNLIHVSDGYYRIQSVYSGLYVGTDSLDPSTITQTNAENDSTLWKFVETVSGNQRIVCKSTSTVISAASASAGNDSTLIASSYTNDASLNDEWIPHRILPVSGSEIPYEPELWVFYEDWD